MSSERTDADRLEERLRESLARLEDRIEEVLHVDMPLDPDALLADLGGHARELERLVHEAGRVLTRPPVRNWSVSVDDLVRAEIVAVLDTVKFPLICRTKVEPVRLEGVDDGGPDRLRAALRRSLILACSFAGTGGELEVRAGDTGSGVAIVALATRPGQLGETTGDDQSDAIDVRSRSLEEFVGELGGSLQVCVDREGRLVMSLEFSHVLS